MHNFNCIISGNVVLISRTLSVMYIVSLKCSFFNLIFYIYFVTAFKNDLLGRLF